MSVTAKSGDIETRTVTWTETFTVTIGCGHYHCEVCECVTPLPTDDEVARFANQQPGDNFMWPGQQDWVPDGWEANGSELLCPACVAAKNKALAKRRRKSSP